MIFSDKTLVEMAASNPGTVEDLLSVHGVGAAKLKKYGKIFFDLIHRNKKAEPLQ
jgi:ATP-dependent DNA helicase RecQ